MQGRIMLELRTKTPDTGSGLPDLGHDAYWLMKQLPGIVYKDANGKERPLGDKYRIIEARIAAGPVPDADQAG